MVQLTQFRNEIENAQENTGSSVVPSGEYIVACVSTESKPYSSRTGHYILNQYEIQEGEHIGKKLRDVINYDNPNEIARNIAFATIKSLGIAIGKTEPLTDTNELIGKRIIAVVETKDGNNPILDEQGRQKVDNEGKPLFYKDTSIKKYKSVVSVNNVQYNNNYQPNNYQSTNNYQQPQSNNGSFPFPK